MCSITHLYVDKESSSVLQQTHLEMKIIPSRSTSQVSDTSLNLKV
jgi:hypothetical protein